MKQLEVRLFWTALFVGIGTFLLGKGLAFFFIALTLALIAAGLIERDI